MVLVAAGTETVYAQQKNNTIPVSDLSLVEQTKLHNTKCDITQSMQISFKYKMNFFFKRNIILEKNIYSNS